MKRIGTVISIIVIVAATMIAIPLSDRVCSNIVEEILFCSGIGVLSGALGGIISILLSLFKSSNTFYKRFYKENILTEYNINFGEKKIPFDSWASEQLAALDDKSSELQIIPTSENTNVIPVEKCLTVSFDAGGIIKVDSTYYYISQGIRGLSENKDKKELKGFRLPDEMQCYLTDIL